MLQVSVGETVTLITEPKVKSFLAGASGKEPACQCRRYKRCAFDPWVRKIPWRRCNPLQYPCPENSTDRGAWRATVQVHRIAQSWT